MRKSIWAQSAIFLLVMVSLIFQGCTTVAQKISQEKDATVAYKLPLPQVETFRLSDRDALKKILEDHIEKYLIGVGYLKKAADLYQGAEGVAHDKKIVEVEIEINQLKALIDNLPLLYPDQWEGEKEKISETLERLKEAYKKAYEGLV